jgi:hypothetical protein
MFAALTTNREVLWLKVVMFAKGGVLRTLRTPKPLGGEPTPPLQQA